LKVFLLVPDGQEENNVLATDDERRKTIVSEIDHWRRSKLLPGQYCDFLQNLYLEDVNERPKGAVSHAVRQIGQASGRRWMLVFGIFTLICVVALHFSAFPLPLQIGLVALVTIGFVGLAVYWREDRPLLALPVMGAGMLFLFGAGAVVLQLHGWTEGIGPAILLVICAAMCIGCGLIVRLAFVHWLGWMAVIALYAQLLIQHVPHPSWGQTQLFWIPAALLFCWLSWYLHVRFQSVGLVLFTTAFIVWFMPELHASLIDVNPQWVQFGLVGKTLLAGLGMYKLRKQWMEWVVQ
jgi:hypothetical protein